MIKKILLAVAMIAPMLASAQTVKIGLVDFTALIQAMPETAAMETTLSDMQKKYEADYNRLGDEMKRQYEELQKMPADELPAIRERKTREFQDQSSKLQMFEQQIMQDMQRKQNELSAPIIQKARAAVESVGREGGYSLIQDNNSQLTLYFASPVEDITPLVKAKLGLK